MRIVDCEQSSDRWHLCRKGRPTASRYGAIITSTGKPCTGQTRETYMLELLAERLTGRVTDHYVSSAMDRGTILEPRARDWYTMQTGQAVNQIGFAYTDDGRAGASPDGLCGDVGAIEIKCPGDKAQIVTLMRGKVPVVYVPQVHGVMWVCERQWCDFISWTDSGLPSVVIRVARCNDYIAAMREAVGAFCDELDEREADLRKRYGIEPRESADIEQASGDKYPFPNEPLPEEA